MILIDNTIFLIESKLQHQGEFCFPLQFYDTVRVDSLLLIWSLCRRTERFEEKATADPKIRVLEQRVFYLENESVLNLLTSFKFLLKIHRQLLALKHPTNQNCLQTA